MTDMCAHASLETLHRTLDVGLPIFVLIDPLLGEPPPVHFIDEVDDESGLNGARKHAWAREVRRVELPIAIDLPPRLHPYLVELAGPGDPWLEQTWDVALAERAATRDGGLAGTGRGAMRIGGWLQCEFDLQTLAQALAELMRLRTAVSTPARYLRLADRRTLDWLSFVIGRTRITASLGLVRRWCWLDTFGGVASIESALGEVNGALRLSADEWTTFALAEDVHPCIARCLGELESASETPQPVVARQWFERAHRAVLAARAAARRWPGHLPGADDRIAWAALSLLQPGFEETAACRHWLAVPSPGPDHDRDAFNVHCHTLRASLAPPSEHTT